MPGQRLNLPLLTPVCGKKRHYTQAEGQADLETPGWCDKPGGRMEASRWRFTGVARAVLGI
jgi:hypothetical protein